ncbi:MAG: hypothetical protein BWY31_02447 [Lentisphaerae bacterium ADurb.Bin242]|nr:MAG: hypothetical protein BWY31_02447 [Lentisphaerae bacterium ADurb.Bin242]
MVIDAHDSEHRHIGVLVDFFDGSVNQPGQGHIVGQDRRAAAFGIAVPELGVDFFLNEKQADASFGERGDAFDVLPHVFQLGVREDRQSIFEAFIGFGRFPEGGRHMEHQFEIVRLEEFRPVPRLKSFIDVIGRFDPRTVNADAQGPGAHEFVAFQHFSVDAVLVKSEKRVAFCDRIDHGKAALGGNGVLSPGFEQGFEQKISLCFRGGNGEFDFLRGGRGKLFFHVRHFEDDVSGIVFHLNETFRFKRLVRIVFHGENKPGVLSGEIVAFVAPRRIECNDFEVFRELGFITFFRCRDKCRRQREKENCGFSHRSLPFFYHSDRSVFLCEFFYQGVGAVFSSLIFQGWLEV